MDETLVQVSLQSSKINVAMLEASEQQSNAFISHWIAAVDTNADY